jgi:hypothetical protein
MLLEGMREDRNGRSSPIDRMARMTPGCVSAVSKLGMNDGRRSADGDDLGPGRRSRYPFLAHQFGAFIGPGHPKLATELDEKDKKGSRSASPCQGLHR